MRWDAPLNSVSEPVGTIDVALSHAKRLLEKDPELAAEQAREILSVSPGHPLARLILGAAHRHAGRALAALEVLEPLAKEQPNASAAHLELGIAQKRSRSRGRCGGCIAPGSAIAARFGGCLAPAGRYPRCGGRRRRRRPSPGSLHQGGDQGSAADGGCHRVGGEQSAGRRSALAHPSGNITRRMWRRCECWRR